MVALGIALLYAFGCWWFYKPSVKFASDAWLMSNDPSTNIEDTIERASILFKKKLKLLGILFGYMISGFILGMILPNWSLSQAIVLLGSAGCLYGIVYANISTLLKRFKSSVDS